MYGAMYLHEPPKNYPSFVGKSTWRHVKSMVGTFSLAVRNKKYLLCDAQVHKVVPTWNESLDIDRMGMGWSGMKTNLVV